MLAQRHHRDIARRIAIGVGIGIVHHAVGGGQHLGDAQRFFHAAAVVPIDQPGIHTVFIHMHARADEPGQLQVLPNRLQIERSGGRYQPHLPPRLLVHADLLHPLRIQARDERRLGKICGDRVHLFAGAAPQEAQRALLAPFSGDDMPHVERAQRSRLQQMQRGAQPFFHGVKAKRNDGIAPNERPVKIKQRVALLQARFLPQRYYGKVYHVSVQKTSS